MKIFFLVVVLLGGLLKPQVSAARSPTIIGNGGDHIRLVFLEGKYQASKILTDIITDENIDNVPMVSVYAKEWLKTNAQALSDDIFNTEHEWVDENPPTCPDTCACTGLEPRTYVSLEFSTCRETISSIEDAGRLLTHESVHHFGIGTEKVADEIAFAVYEVHRQNAITAPTYDFQYLNSPEYFHRLSEAFVTHSLVFLLSPFNSISGPPSIQVFDMDSGQWDDSFPLDEFFNRAYPSAVNLERGLFVWGGARIKDSGLVDFSTSHSSGGIINVEDGSFTETSSENAPSPRFHHSSVVINDSEIAIFSGFSGSRHRYVETAGIYNVETDTWRPMSMENGPKRNTNIPPVLAENKIVVFQPGAGKQVIHIYDIDSDVWETVQIPDAISERKEAYVRVFWTGRKVLLAAVGYNDDLSLLEYDLEFNAWHIIEGTEAFAVEMTRGFYNTMIWNGNKFIAWGRDRRTGKVLTGVSYDPALAVWRKLASPKVENTFDKGISAWVENRLMIMAFGAGVNTGFISGFGRVGH